MLRGIDISHHNGVIDWKRLNEKMDIDFVIAKATEGTDFTDRMFARNMDYCKELCILHGAYHYVRGDYDALEQARHFIEVVEAFGDSDTLLALDVEDKTLTNLLPAKVTKIVTVMAAEIYDKLHTYPLIYVSKKFMNPAMFADIGRKCGGWIADWSGHEKPIRADLNTTIWQYTSNGSVVGIPTKVDRDIAYLTPENWVKIANPEGLR